MKLTKTYQFPAPPAEVARALCSEGFIMEMEQLREEFVSTRIDVRENTEERVEFEVITVEHVRKMSGAINRKKTLTARNLKIYDARAGTMSWSYTGQGAKVSELTGLFTFHPDSEGTRMVHDISIKIKVPLVGERIARAISEGFKKSFPVFEKTVLKHLPR